MSKAVTCRLKSLTVVAICVVAMILAACQREGNGTPESAAEPAATAAAPKPDTQTTTQPSAGTEQRVEVTALNFAFAGPDTIPAGWTTFELRNESDQHHFMMVYRLPQGRSFEDLKQTVVPVFDQAMAALQAGEIDKAAAMERLGADIPAWYFDSTFWGGPGLVAPGRSARTTVLLNEPGTYIMECYVKSPDGRFHSSMGMARPITVTQERSETTEPEASLELTLSRDEIRFDAKPMPGTHTIRVNFAAAPDSPFPYDVHLARLDDDEDLDAATAWMDWMDVGGLRAPSPVTFIGGAEQMPAGSTAYVTVTLEPGRYAWLPETYAAQGMVKEFVVAAP